MKFYDKYIGRKRMPNYMVALAAVMVSLAMWYFIRVGEQMETTVEVNLDYSNVPSNLVITSGLVSKVNVRLRGPAVLIRSIPKEMRNYTINLSAIKKGVTAVPLGGEDMLAIYRAFEVIDIDPPRIVVEADNLVERKVSVHAVFDSPLDEGAIPVENSAVNPSIVTLRGPESVVNGIPDLPVVIHLDPLAADAMVSQSKILDTPNLVTANPASVRVDYRVTSGREVVPRICPVTLSGKNSASYKVEPAELGLLVELPKRMAKDKEYLGKIKLSVPIPQLEPGESQAIPPSLELPDGATLAKPINEEVIVTRVK